MSKEPWLIEVHDEFDYERFLNSLSLAAAEALHQAIWGRLRDHGNELAGTSAVKAMGDKLFEYRIVQGSNASGGKMLVRVFFTYRKGRVILLLGAYDKLADSSKTQQQKQIAIARQRLWRQFMLEVTLKGGAAMPKQDFYEIGERLHARAAAELPPEVLKAIHDDVAERGAIIDLAIAVRKARKKAGLTQASLAELTGVTQAQLSRIERGEFAPRIETLAKIAIALKTQFVIGPESSSASPSAA